jgi:hypothetical protein
MAGCYHIRFAFESVINSLGKTWRLGKLKGKRKGGSMDGMVIQHHRLNEHEFGQTLGGSGGQKSLSMECKELDTT